MTGEVRLDLHVHSRHSPDSPLSLEALARRIPDTGLRGFALTDHNSVAGHAELRELRRAYPSYLFLPGVEVSTIEGHLLAYGVSEAPPPHRPVRETVEWVRAHGGESVLAHPFRLRHGVGGRIAETVTVDGIEVRNGHNSEINNAKAELLAARRQLAATGGSDVHALTDLGRAYTRFPDEAATVDDLLEAIRKQQTIAEGRSMAWVGRARLVVVNTGKFLRRGFHSV
ncbi:MAG TPA: CehA/McbA family metallohydrolase [Thermoplasmata archaeon]|nr:CehA/McbA family metallohydrolase [Thermoplasmata archaeon]